VDRHALPEGFDPETFTPITQFWPIEIKPRIYIPDGLVKDLNDFMYVFGKEKRIILDKDDILQKRLNYYDILRHSGSYHHNHGIEDSDIVKANRLKKLIEESRDRNKPKKGDIIIARGPKRVYNNGHIQEEAINDYSAMCVQPYVPFCSRFHDTETDTDHLGMSTSGGYWFKIPCDDLDEAIEMLEYKGTRSKLFKDWGHCGPCGDGAFTFEATVNVWEVFLESIY
jgi:hypothetical protein